MASRGRIVIVAAFIALGLGFFGYYYYANLDIPELEKVQLELVDVKVLEVNSIDNRANLEVSFLVTNSGKRTVTISNINYELFANGKNIGNGQYSTEDIALPGRALIYPSHPILLTNTFDFVYTDRVANEYLSITKGEQVSYTTTGTLTVESAWTLLDKNFESSFG